MLVSRRKINPSAHSHANFDALLNILIGTIGFMLIAVLFTVLSAGAKMVVTNLSVTIYAPILKAAPQAEHRELILCQRGRIFVFGLDRVEDELANELRRSSDPSKDAMTMNGRVIRDRYFQYTVKLRATPQQLIEIKGAMPIISLLIQSLGTGETIDTFQSSASLMRSHLQSAANSQSWIHFLVDGESIDIFRAARKTLASSGARIGWEPLTLAFPYEECVLGCGGNGAAGLQIIRGYQNTAR